MWRWIWRDVGLQGNTVAACFAVAGEGRGWWKTVIVFFQQAQRKNTTRKMVSSAENSHLHNKYSEQWQD